MDQEVIIDLFNRAKSKGYKKTQDEFVQLLYTDQQVFNDMFSYVKSKGYQKTEDDFSVLIGKKKDEAVPEDQQGPLLQAPQEGMVSPSGATSLESPSDKKPIEVFKGFTPEQLKGLQASATEQPDAARIKAGIAKKQKESQQKEKERAEFTAASMSEDDFSGSLQQVNTELVDYNEEYIVPKLEYMFGNYGFEFSEAGAGRDAIEVVAPNGSRKTISVDNWTDKGDMESSIELRDFINANKPKIVSLATEYNDYSKKIKTDREIGESINRLNDEADSLFEEQKKVAVEFANLQKQGEYLLTDDAKASPEYQKMIDDYNKSIELINSKVADISKKEAGIKSKSQKLNTAIGQYTEMKSEQGTLGGAAWNSLLNSIGGIEAAFVGMSIDLAASIIPIEYQMSDDDYRKAFAEKAAARGINIPKNVSKESFDIWVSKLDEDLRNEIDDKIVDENKKGAKELFLPTIRERYTDILGDVATTKEFIAKKQEETVAGGIIGLAGSVPGIAASVAAAPAGVTAFFLMGMDAAMQEMSGEEFKDIPESEKYLVAVPIGIVNAVLEEFGLKNVIGKSGIVNNIIAKVLTKTTAKTTAKTFKELVENEVQSRVTRGLLTVGAAGLAEAETGGAQAAAEIGIKALYNTAKEKKLFSTPNSMGEFVQEIKKASEQEMVGGIVIGTVPAISTAYKDNNYNGLTDTQLDIFQSFANDANFRTAIVTDLKYQINSGKINAAQAKETLDNYTYAAGILNSLPEGLSNAQKRKAMGLLQERKTIENQIQGKDEALVKKQKGRIAEINKELEVISEGLPEIEAAPAAAPETAPVTITYDQLSDEAKRLVDDEVKLHQSKIDQAIANNNQPDPADVKRLDELKSNPIQYLQDIASTSISQTRIDKVNQALTKIKEEQDAIQKQAAGQVPVQQAPTAGEAVAQGVPAAGPEVTPTAGVQAEEGVVSSRTLEEQVAALEQMMTEEETNDVVQQFGSPVQSTADAEAAMSRGDFVYVTDEATGTPTLVSDVTTLSGYTPDQMVVVAKENMPAVEAAPAPAMGPAMAPVAVSNKAALDTLKAQTTDTTKRRVISMAEKAINTLKSVFPDMDINIHTTAESYNQAMSELNGTMDSAGNFAAIGDRGIRIDINLSKASGTTVAHEVAHAIMLKTFGDNPALFKKFRNRILKVLSESRINELNEFADQYAEEASHEEFMVQLTGMLSDNSEQLSRIEPTTIQKIADAINQFVSYVTKGRLVPFEGTVRTNQLVDFLNTMSTAITKGEEVTVTEKTKGAVTKVGVASKAQKAAKDIPMSASNVLYADSDILPKPTSKISNAAVAKLIANVAADFWGGSKINSITMTPEQEELIVDNGIEETEKAFLSSGKNAADWYSTAIETAIEVAGVIHPELTSKESALKIPYFAKEKDPVAAAQMVMRMALAITSQNINVEQNAKYAEEQFDFFKKNGRFDSNRKYGAKAKSISSNLELVNIAISKIGNVNDLEGFIKSEFTVNDLESAFKNATGKSVKISGLRNDIVNGAAIFGPKIGQGFLQNLMGNFMPVTIDLWMRRTWGRWTGDVVGHGVTEDRVARLINSVKEANRNGELSERLPSALLKYKQKKVVDKKGKVTTTMDEDFVSRVEEDADFVNSINASAKKIASLGDSLYKLIRYIPMSKEIYNKFISGDLSYVKAAKKLESINKNLNTKYAEYTLKEKQNKRKPIKKADWMKAQYEKMGMTITPSNEDIAKRKPEWVKAATVIKNELNPIDIPSNADRRVITRVVNKIREGMAKKGYLITNADVQALLWYPEKDIWSKLRGEQESNLKLSYDDEFIKIAEQRGLGDQAKKAAERVRSRRSKSVVRANEQRREGEVYGGVDQYVSKSQLAGPTAGNRLFNEPLKEVASIADRYYKRVFGRTRPKYTGTKVLDKDRSKRISDAFIKMKHDPFNPEVKRSYDALAKEVIDQYKAFLDAGYSIEINNEESYNNSQEMIDDLRNNNRIKILSTESGFGSKQITDAQRRENPMLNDSGFKDVNGITMLVNDVFRAIHDFYGHAELGNSFGPKGEENAWNVHARMFSPLARKAMTTETRGQNSYVNFSGVNDEIEKLRDQARERRKNGDEKGAQKIVEKIYELASFADQKIGLLPEEFYTIDETDTGDMVVSKAQVSAEGAAKDKYRVSIVFKSKFGGRNTKTYEFNDKRHFDNWLKKNGDKYDISEIYELKSKAQVASEVKQLEKGSVVSKAQVDAYHGSPYDFDEFTLSKIGTGEGAQAFGWGLYFTDIKSIAEGYANKLGDYKIVIPEKYISALKNNFDYKAGGVAYDLDYVLSRKDQLSARNQIRQGLENAIINLKIKLDRAKEITGIDSSIYKRTLEELTLLKELKEKGIKIEQQKKLYQVTLHQGKTPDQYTWLEWDKPVSEKAKDRIYKQFQKEEYRKEIVDKSKLETYKLLGIKGEPKLYRPTPIGTTGGVFYNELVSYFTAMDIKNPQKEASLFLLDAGIDGVKYPAESVARGATSDTARGFNYVVFDDKAITIVSKAQKRADAKKAVQKTVANARAQGFSEEAIRIFLGKRGFSQDDIDEFMKSPEAAKKIKLTEELAPGYDRMMEQVDGIIETGLEVGSTQEEIMNDVIQTIKSSAAYKNATDIQKDQMIRDAEEAFGQKQKAAPRAERGSFIYGLGRLLGFAKKEVKMVTVPEYELLIKGLKDYIKGFAKGEAEGKKAGEAEGRKAGEAKGRREMKSALRQATKDLSDVISQFVGEGKISSKQMNTIMKRFSNVNVFSDISVAKFIDYMSKVLADADYASKLSEANSLRSSIKRLSKNKEKNANLRDLATKFADIDPSIVEDIDKYNEMASRIKEAVKGSTIRAGKMTQAQTVSIAEAMEYINDATEKQINVMYQRKLDEVQEMLGVDASDLSYEQLFEMLGQKKPSITKYNEGLLRSAINKMFDTYSALVEEMLSTGTDPFTGETVDISKKNKDLVTRFMEMDLNNLTPRQALDAADALANFAQNGSTAKMEAVVSAYNGEVNAAELDKKGFKSIPLKAYWSRGIGRLFGEQLMSLPVLLDRMFKGVGRAAVFERMSGIASLRSNKSAADARSIAIINDFVKAFYKLKANGENFNSEYNLVERGMYAFMTRNVIGTQKQMDEEFARRRDLINESIDVLSKGSDTEKKKAEIYKRAYDKIVEGSDNINDVASKTDQTNIDGVKYWTEQWSNIYDDLADVSLNVYNTILGKYTNYTPDRFTRLDNAGEAVPLENDQSLFLGNTNDVYKKKTGVLMESTRPTQLPRFEGKKKAGMYIDLSFDRNNANSMYDALIDINTAADIRHVEAFMNSESFDEIVPEAKDANLLRKRIQLFVRNMRDKNIIESDELSAAARSLNTIASIGVGQALGSLFQPIKQMVPVIANTVANAGTIKMSAITDPTINNFINNSGYAIASRGLASSAEISSIERLVDIAARSTGAKAMKAIEEANKKWLEIFLVKPDVYVARASWMAYYEKSLKSQGVDTKGIDYSTHELNKEAADYAQKMVDRQQNISDHDLAGKIFTSKQPITNMFVKMVMPFASFRINQFMRMTTDLGIFLSRTSSEEDKKNAIRSLRGFAVEQLTFKLISGMLIFSMGTLTKAIMGKDEDEEEKEKRINSVIKGQVTSTVTDVLSPLPMTDVPVKWAASNLLSMTQDAMDIAEEDKLSIYGDTKETAGSSLGTLGITVDRAAQIAELIELSTSGEFKDNYGKTKTISDDDIKVLKAMTGVAVLSSIGLLPTEANTVVRNSIKYAKQDAGKSREQIRKENMKKYMPKLYKAMYGKDSMEKDIEEIKKDIEKATD